MSDLISGKREEINKCNAIKNSLKIEKGKLETCKNKWVLQHQKHCSSQVASEVVIQNVFEGAIADKLRDTYGDQVKNMQETKKKIDTLCGKLESQIQRLVSYVAKLQGEITSAETKINNLED